MLLVLDLGFSSLVLAVCGVFLSLISLVIRRQWRWSTARKEEIKRLMILASQEAARAELEASVGYVSAVLVPERPQCAVCFFPTTRRCAQCKAVQYCSGKCQIVHWRKGHKDECHPPASKSYIDLKPVKDDRSDSYGNTLENGGCEPMRTDPDCFAEVSLLKHSEIEGDLNAEPSFKSSDARFSGFTDSSAINESSDDSSPSERVASNDLPDEHVPDDTENHLLKTSAGAEDVRQRKGLSPKFAILFDSLDGYCSSGLSGLNKQSAICSDERAIGKSTRTSSQGTGYMNNGSIGEPSAASPNFWGSALGPTKMTNRHHASVLPNSKENEFNNSACRSLHFSFNSSGSSVQGPEILYEGIPNKKSNSGATMLEKVEKSGARSSLSLKCRKSADRSSDPPCDSAFQTFVQARSPAISDAALSSSANMASLRGDSSDTRSSSVSDFHSVSRVLDTSVRSDRASETKPPIAPISQQSPNTSSIAKNFLNSAGRVVDQLKGSVMSGQCSLPSSDLAGRYNDKGLFPYEVFVKLYTWKEVELHPCGLINCGNSCYANAVLQCLAFTPPLTAFFLQGLHSKACGKKEWCFMCEFEALLLNAKQSKSPVSPIRILSRLQNIGSQLSSGREEDAHEFLRCTIDAMERICLKESGMMPDSFEANTTLLGLTFGGYLQSKIRCSNCQGRSERLERMMDLTVGIEGDIKTLEEALQRFTVYETLDGENKYKCTRCGSYSKAKKKLTVLEAPNILTIALKLYQSGKYGKINKSVKFTEILNLAPLMSGTSDKSPIYRLYGVIVHLDVMNAAFSGHYICYVKNPQNQWFKIDDSKVTPVDKERVFAASAYMLLYSRCSPRAPRSICNKILSTDSKQKAVIPTLTISKLASASNLTSSSSSNGGLPPNPPLYQKDHHDQQLRPVPPEEDSSFSSSDSSSIFSSNSDECSTSSSTDGTHDSTCSDDLSECLFGQNSSSPWRESPHSEASSSPLFSRRGEETMPFSHFDTTKPNNKKLAHSSSSGSNSNSSSSSSSSSRVTKSDQLAGSDGFDGVNLGVTFRKSTREKRTDKLLYL